MRLSKISVVIIVCLAVVALFLIGCFGILMMGIANYDKYLAKELDNEYINNDYRNWKPVTFFNAAKVYVPETWSVSQDGDICYITDQEGRTVAFCGLVEKGVSRFQNISDFLSALVDFEIEDKEWEYLSGIYVGSAACARVEVRGATQSKQFYTLPLNNGDKDCKLVFPVSEEIERERMLQMLEAIFYSFRYKE